MLMCPSAGTSGWTRQRKSWASSVEVGALNDATWTPEGFTPSNTLRIAPPLPEVSMPCSTTSILWRASA